MMVVNVDYYFKKFKMEVGLKKNSSQEVKVLEFVCVKRVEKRKCIGGRERERNTLIRKNQEMN